MQRKLGKIRQFGTIATIGAISIITMAASCTSTPPAPAPAATSESPSFAPSSPASNADADPVCSSGDSPPVLFTFSNGAPTGLTACTNSDQSKTTIENSQSSNVVWIVTSPTTSPPSIGQDVDDHLPLSDIYFRAYLIDASSTANTIEPGVQVTIADPPGSIRIQQAPALQSAWEVSSLLANSTIKQSNKAIKSALQDHGSPISQALFTCISTGYSFWQQLQSGGQVQQLSPQAIQSQLSTYMDLSNRSSACGSKIDAAEAAREPAAPDLSLGKVQLETTEDPEWLNAGDTIDNAARDLERAVIGRVHE